MVAPVLAPLGAAAVNQTGRRVKKVQGSATTVYVYDAGGQLAADYTTASSTDSGTQYLTADHLGSTRVVTDSGGLVKARYDYQPFGPEILVTSASPRYPVQGYGANLALRHKFTGKERDAETGLDYFGARYFPGAQGRFTTPDPFNPILRISSRAKFNLFISQPQNWNAYGYVWNNPLRYTDPNGENVYLVLYTQGNSKGDEVLRRAAQTKAAEMQRSRGFDPKKDQVILSGVVTRDDFRNALAGANKAGLSSGGVQQVNLFSHSGADGPVFHGGTVEPSNPHGATQFSPSELSSLPGITWSQGASATFYGCNTTNFAGRFASVEDVKSLGTTGSAYFSSRPDRLSSVGRTGSVYLIDTIFNRLAPNIVNFTKPMEEHDPE